MLFLLTIAVFLGAFLLFLVQPMAARAVLPVLGGSPSVWNTCMVFFQAALLAGYAYAHGLLRVRRMWVGVGVHAGLAVAALAALPLAIREAGAARDPSEPVWWLLATLTASVGAPFFVLAATGPLVQGWLARTGHRSAQDPYFLYAASNAGSMLALLAYPLAVEPVLTLGQQERAWSGAYAGFVAVIVGCGVVCARASAPKSIEVPSGQGTSMARVTWGGRGRWVLLAFIPSSLMLGVTQHISTDIAPVPLMWIVPLAIYLLSFILVFAGRGWGRGRFWSVALAVLAVVLGAAFLVGARRPLGVLIALHLFTLLAASMVCHGRLAAERPAADRLTGFYLLIAVGGVLGGIFNAVVAPAVFEWVAEFPLVLALACAMRIPGARVASVAIPARATPPRSAGRGKASGRAASPEPAPEPWREAWARVRTLVWTGRTPGAAIVLDVLWPLWVPVLYLWITRRFAYVAVAVANLMGYAYSPDRADFLGGELPLYLSAIVPALLCCLFMRRNARFAIALAALFASGYYLRPLSSEPLLRERTFFGVYRVDAYRVQADSRDPGSVEEYHWLSHGTTQHGLQNMTEGKRGDPLVYFHRAGPIGQVMAALRGDPRLRQVGLVGLGAGVMAAYGEPGEAFTFYEIDPAVVRIARNPALFTYLSESRATVRVEAGDGRLLLGDEPDGKFGLLVLDAFSSDAIPVHLLTVEAFRGYLAKLGPDGLIAFHITNRHLDLTPVIAGAAEELGLTGVWQTYEVRPEDEGTGGSTSTWVVLGRSGADLAPILADGRWALLRPRAGFRAWTDDFSNIWSIFRWE